MITSQGSGLIVELIAAALMIAALTGLFVQRSKPWMIRGHDGIRDTHSGRDGSHRFIDLGTRHASGSSGSLAIFAAIRCASSFESSFATDVCSWQLRRATF
jgi:hypothetical protein